MPAAPTPGLPRRVLRRLRRELAARRRVTVRAAFPPGSHRRLRGYRLRIVAADAAGLLRVAAAGRLTGEVCELVVELAHAPDSQLVGVRPPRPGRTATAYTWRRRGDRLRVRLRWARPYGVQAALADGLRSVLRARQWEQASGPVYALDPDAWRQGRWSWPQGRLAAAPPAQERDAAGRRLGPYHPAPARTEPASASPIVTAVANPFGRRLVGAATAYRLVHGPDRVQLRDSSGAVVWHADPAGGPEAGVARGRADRYAVAIVDTPVPEEDRFRLDCLRTLAACGTVFAAADPALRSGLAAHGLVVVADPATVADLPGYALSVAAARRMALAGDAALRRTPLGTGDRSLPLPTITAVVSTMRAEHLESILGYLAAQTYPALEAVIGLHGYDLSPADRARHQLPFPARMVSFHAQRPFGEVLGALSRLAEGDLLTKLDDDDHYGPHHLTDLFLAWHTSGADLVAKGARFVYFPERGETIDRAWAAPELFNVTPAGGTMLLGRGALAEVGGWSHSSKHVDADLLARVRDAGGLVYRTHALEYAYVRRSAGHTFVTGLDELLSHGERSYPDLPAEIVDPERRKTVLEGRS